MDKNNIMGLGQKNKILATWYEEYEFFKRSYNKSMCQEYAV